MSVDVTSPVWLADPVDRHHPLNHGRAAWWLALPGIDGGATWYDLMGLNHGTLANAPSWVGTTRPGGCGAINFGGTGARVSAPYPPANAFVFTVAAWVRQTTQTGYRAVFASSFPKGLYLNGGKIDYYTGSGDTLAATAMSSGAWHRVVWSADGANAVAYLDGAQDFSGAFTAALPSGAGIGSDGAGNNFAGDIDDVSVWTRPLSAAEAFADYDLSRRGYPGVLRRVPSRVMTAGAAPVVGAFNAAWAAQSSRIIHGGTF